MKVQVPFVSTLVPHVCLLVLKARTSRKRGEKEREKKKALQFAVHCKTSHVSPIFAATNRA